MKADQTYIEDMEDPVEVLLPTSNLFLIGFRVEESRGHVSLTLLDDHFLNRGHSPGIEALVSGVPGGRVASPTHPVS